MPWFKVDDSFWGNPKQTACPASAIGLWVRAGSWSAQQLTDGFVPRHMLSMFGARPKDAADLVSSGLWETTEGGWVFHDWSSWQPSRRQVEEQRAAAAARKQSWRDKRGAERTRNANVPMGHGGDTPVPERVTDAAVLVPRPDPTRPDRSSYGTTEESGPRKRGHRIPDDFAVDDALRKWAGETVPNIDVDFETGKFVDYWQAAAGRNATKLDWRKAWQVWMRDARPRPDLKPVPDAPRKFVRPDPLPGMDIHSDAYQKYLADCIAKFKRGEPYGEAGVS